MKTIKGHNFPTQPLAKIAGQRMGTVAVAGAKARRNYRQPAIPIGAGLLGDGVFLELVRVDAQELLLHGSARQFRIASDIADGRFRYTASRDAGLIRHLPSKPTPYRDTETLFSAIANFISKHTGLDDEDALLLSFMTFSSYFCDCLSTVPCLLLFGAPLQAVSLLRVLGCLCRHPILSVGSSVGVPAELRPTRLICQSDARVDRELAALQFSGFGILGSRPRQISGTTVIYAGDTGLKNPLAEICLQLWVSPAECIFGVQEEEQQAAVISELQNQMLSYRLQNYAAVKASSFDVPEFRGATREHARALGRCIVDGPDLQSRLTTLLRKRDDAERTESASTLDVAVLEALGVCCHERKPSVHIGEIASLANALLSRSGEVVELSAKQVGGRIKGLGFRTTRLDAAGRGIYLLNGECARVHKLGRGLGAPIFREGLQGCPYCETK